MSHFDSELKVSMLVQKIKCNEAMVREKGDSVINWTVRLV